MLGALLPSTWKEPTQRRERELNPLFFFYIRPSLGITQENPVWPTLTKMGRRVCTMQVSQLRDLPVTEHGFCPHPPHLALAICLEPAGRREAMHQATSGSPTIGNLSKVTPLASEETVVDTQHLTTVSCTPPPSLGRKLCPLEPHV